MKLINGAIKQIDTGGKPDHIEWDDELKGFGLRIRQGKGGARRSYIVQYKVGALNRRMVIGDADKIDPKQARAAAKKELAKVELGEDPQGEKKGKRTVGTFKAIATEFIEHQEKKRRASTVYSSRLYLLGRTDRQGKLVPAYYKDLHNLKPEEIGRGQVAAVLKSIAKAHGPVSADRARAALSSMFAWAIGEALCGEAFDNPVVGTNRASSGKSPGRALDADEIAAIWNAAGDGEFGRIVKLLFLTGCRRNEIAKLEWDEVGKDLISISSSRTKNHLQFDVPLADLARDIIGPRQERKYVFGRYSTSGGFGGFSKAKVELDAKLKGVKPWRLHDIRHTVSTRMHGELSIEPHIVEACLNHVSGAKAGVAGRYNHAAYNAQKRDAFEAWAQHIKVILAQASGANVKTLPRRA